MTAMVFKFGVGYRVNGVTTQVPDAVTTQLRLATDLHNRFVRIFEDYTAAKAALWASHPLVVETETQLAAAEDALAVLVEQAAGERSKDRTTAARPKTSKEITAAKRAVKEAKAARRAAISAAYETDPTIPTRLTEIGEARKQALKDEYWAFCAVANPDRRGLHWPTYNMVLADHETAVKRLTQRRTDGQPAQLGWRRWDGTGTIAVQLQRAHGDCRCEGCVTKHNDKHPDDLWTVDPARPPKDPVRSPELIASGGGKWRNVLQISPWMPPEQFNRMGRAERKKHTHGRVRFHLGGDEWADLPLTVHRMMPANADIAEAQLTVTETAGQKYMSVAVTVLMPDPTPPTRTNRIAVHVGWRKMPDGAVRVGVFHTAEPLPPNLFTKELAPYLAGLHDHGGQIVLPAEHVDRAGNPPAIRAQRDTEMAPVVEAVAVWLEQHPQSDLTAGDVRRWRSARRFVRLANKWAINPPEGAGAPEIVELLTIWRQRDRHLWQYETNERQNLILRRDDVWRKIGATLAEVAGTIVVDDTVLTDVRRRPAPTETDPTLPGVAATKARARAALAAPGMFRSAVTAAAVRRGVTVTKVPAAYLTRTCPECGVIGDADPRYAAARVVECLACGKPYDQDVSAAHLMLGR